jgi:polyhydroxybutyrate depolymerase
MKNVYGNHTSAFCYGICLAAGLIGTGCIDDANQGDGEGSSSSAITIDTTANYAIVGVQSGKCVGVVDSSTASNARLEIRPCAGIASQRVHPEAMGGGFFRLRNELSGLCLDVSGASTADGAAVIQFACSTAANQQWSFTDVASGGERLTARHSGKVFDVTGAVSTDGTLIEQFTSNNGANQQFTLAKQVPALLPE